MALSDLAVRQAKATGKAYTLPDLDGLSLAVTPLQTVTDKRATFACTPALRRPGQVVAPGLLACGDYIAGPYPATLEGAVQSGVEAACALR